MNAIQLRSANLSDAASLGAVHVAAWHETYTGILPEEMLASLSVEGRAAMWSKILAAPAPFSGTAVYVSEDHDRIVGFGACGQPRDEELAYMGFDGEIGAIYVLRSHQRLGIGRSLMGMMAQALLVQGCTAATLWVVREHGSARNFYDHLGGKVVGEKKDERPNATLFEVAYGWHDLSRLVC